MTPEPSNEYQKLVEALWDELCVNHGSRDQTHVQIGRTDFFRIARAALSALKLPHVTEQMVERGWSAFVMAMGDIEKDVLLDDMTPDEERAIVRAILVHALALPTPPAGVSDNG